MEQGKNKYPGFIDGLKASNISINKPSLDIYSDKILTCISLLHMENSMPDLLNESLKKCKEIINHTIDVNSPNDVIVSYIRFGELFSSILPSLKQQFQLNQIKEIVLSYLQIAKYSSDTRINILSITIAKEFEKNEK